MALHRHEPDHIVPIQHGGVTEAINLALACLRCNRYKGPNVGSFDPLTGLLVPLFHPRLQSWGPAFHVVGAEISRSLRKGASPFWFFGSTIPIAWQSASGY
ncbi:HNH endonuclease signature motif containing protein [Candidatus Amarolinea dominans]|uniref:HNH endonuclease n=1 Tax=Candidatus Amarolinea dominans TaxID=3140696 RepID=UPI0031CCC7A8